MAMNAYRLDRERGFLPGADPLKRLPDAFLAWEEAGRELPKTLMSGDVRARLETLPLLDAAELAEERERRRAMILLSFLGHAYVWGNAGPVEAIPACIAKPWHAVARVLGRPPVLSYASYALDNWRRLEPTKPVELGNLAMLQNFLGGQDEEWFVLVHVAIEAHAGPALAAIHSAQRAVAADATDVLADRLTVIAQTLDSMHEVLLRMPERCDPYIYFHRVRPYLHGWAGHPGLTGGLRYEGVAEYGGRPQEFRGETGAQSSIVPTLDAALGISHADDPLRGYLREMLAYMPPAHRSFIRAVEKGPAIRAYVIQRRRKHPALREAYNAAVTGIERFRATHFEYVHRYIVQQDRGDRRNPNDVGTGGTPFVPYLRKHRDETNDHLVAGD